MTDEPLVLQGHPVNPRDHYHRVGVYQFLLGKTAHLAAVDENYLAIGHVPGTDRWVGNAHILPEHEPQFIYVSDKHGDGNFTGFDQMDVRAAVELCKLDWSPPKPLDAVTLLARIADPWIGTVWAPNGPEA